MATNVVAVTADIPITIKIAIDGTNRKFKLPLKELTDPDFLKSKVGYRDVALTATCRASHRTSCKQPLEN